MGDVRRVPPGAARRSLADVSEARSEKPASGARRGQAREPFEPCALHTFVAMDEERPIREASPR